MKFATLDDGTSRSDHMDVIAEASKRSGVCDAEKWGIHFSARRTSSGDSGTSQSDHTDVIAEASERRAFATPKNGGTIFRLGK